MTLIGILLVIVVIGVIVALVPMDDRFKNLAFVVTVLFVILCLLAIFGVYTVPGLRLK